MLEKGFVTRSEWKAHIQTHPFVAHDIWPRIKDYVPSFGYSKAEIDAFFEPTVGGKKQINYENVIGLAAGAIPYGTGATGLDGAVANIYYDSVDNLLGVRESSPTARVHINSVGGSIPCLNLEGGAEGEIVTPDGQQLRLGHWNSGTTTFTERAKMDASGIWYMTYLTTASVLFAGAGGEIKQDAGNFYYNVATHSLGLGGSPTNVLYVYGLGTTAGWGGAYGGVMARFLTSESKHTSIVIDAQAGYDAVLGFSKGGAVYWAIRNDHSSSDAFQIRMHNGVNRTDFQIDSSGNITIPTGYLGIMSQHELRFYDNGNYVGFEAPALGADQIWVLPSADGPANEALGTDGAGNLIWRTHDELAGFEANEHVALPNTIANVLSDHDKAAHDALGLSHDSLVDVSIDDHHARDHQATHNNAGADALKLDDLATPDDNTDLDVSTTRHGLVPKGTDVGNFLRDDGTWAACSGGTDEKVAVDAVATPGYLGAGAGDGVLRVDSTISYTDGGDFVTLGVDAAYVDHGGLGGLSDDDHPQYILHSLADAANDFLVASGANTYVKKTLAETGAILEGDINHDNLVGYEADEHLALPNTIANVLTDHNKAGHDALGLSHDSLSDVSSDDHHAEDHAAEHEVGGGDLVSHDSLTDFVAAEHLLVGAIDHDSLLNYVAGEHLLVGAIDHDSLLNYEADEHVALPNTIANVLSDHNKATHDALNIDADTLDSHDTAYFAAAGGAYHDGFSDFVADEHIAHALGRVKLRDARADGDVTPDNYPSGQASFIFTDDIAGSPNSWDSVIVMKGWSAGYAVWQLFSCSDNGPSSTDLLFRVGIDAAWGSVRTIWDSGNDGPGSGLNADLLDGVEGSGYAVASHAMATHSDDDTYNINTSGTATVQGLNIVRTAGSALTVSLTSTEDAHLIVEGDRDNDDEAMHAWASFLQDGGVRWLRVGVGEAANNNAGFLHGYEGIEFWIGSSFPGGSKIAEILSTGLGITGTLTASGYVYCTYLNTTSGETTGNPTHYFYEVSNDSFLRQSTPANFVTQLAADGLMPKAGGTFTGAAVAADHGAAATDQIVNVCYGTGSPPVANTTTIGTLWIKYTA